MMRFDHLDHIGIAVSDLDESIALYTTLHGTPPSHVTTVAGEQVRVAFFPVGPTNIELLAATHNDSPIAHFIAKRGPGLHHICYATVHFDAMIAELTAAGLTPVARKSTTGANGHRVMFFHPKSTGGVLIELLESKS